jgi:hypothetical protein
MFFFLTNLALDVTLGGGFWILKNTTYGVYNLYSYLMHNNQKLIKYDVDKIDESDMRKLYTDQQLKIDELNNNIKKLTNIVENKIVNDK